MRDGEYREGHWWDAGAWWRRSLVSPLAWHVAGVRDRLTTWRANRGRDIV